MSDSDRDGVDALIDPLLDEVAREMTNLRPPSDLAARVAARIAEADSPSRRRGWTSSWVLAPVAAAAVLLLAVFIAREGSVRLKPDATVIEVAPAASVAPAPVEPPENLRPESVQPSATKPVARAQSIAPLPDPDLTPLIVPSIEFDRLDVSPMARGDAIEIGSIAIERIEITAMP